MHIQPHLLSQGVCRQQLHLRLILRAYSHNQEQNDINREHESRSLVCSMSTSTYNLSCKVLLRRCWRYCGVHCWSRYCYCYCFEGFVIQKSCKSKHLKRDKRINQSS